MGRHEVIVLDTHAAIWFTTNDSALGKRSLAMAEEALSKDQLAVSAISFWEIAMLIAKGRLTARDPAAEQRSLILAAGIRELALTGDVAVMAVALENLHNGPSDRFIVATAIAHDAMLMTADKALLRWRHPLKRQDASK
jgi:PIN domain nuclease of toxin-antitoxin system